MPRVGALRSAVIGAIAALLLVPAVPGLDAPVRAHAQLVAASPGAGSVVDESPNEIRLVFSEPLESQATSFDLALDDGTVLLERAGEVDPADRYALVLADPQLADGTYVLTWRTLSAADGHTAEGFLSFGVGDVATGMVTRPGGDVVHTETDAVGSLGRWLTYIGLLLALGVAVFTRVVLRGPMTATVARALAAVLAVSAVATLVAAVASGAEAGSIVEYLTTGRNGPLQLARAVVAGIGAAVLITAPRPATAVAALTGAIGIVLLVMAGHASAIPGPVAMVGQAVHVAAAAVWIGGIAALVVLAFRPSAMTGAGDAPMREVVPRFSALALVAIGLVALTGVYAAWVQTGVLLDPTTEYGRTLLMKSVVAAAALGIGGLNFLSGGRPIPRLPAMPRRLAVEGALALGVLALTAVLATTPPVEEPAGVAIEPIPDAFGNVTPDMTMTLLPGRPGVNRVVVTTTDTLAGSSSLELGLDRVDTGSTTRVPLVLEGMAGMDHGAAMEGMSHATEAGTAAWVADAVVLPGQSHWDTSVRILSAGGDTEITRQRFAFALSDDSVAEGEVTTLADPALVVGAILLVGGALGLGLGIGSARLPRCEPLASRVALIGGGIVAGTLGILIGASRLVA